MMLKPLESVREFFRLFSLCNDLKRHRFTSWAFAGYVGPDDVKKIFTAIKASSTSKRHGVDSDVPSSTDELPNVAGDHHEFIIETTCGVNDMNEGFHWNIVKNHLLM
ncbi:hypothetical protein Bca101_034701 [Brassica carinata]